MNFIRTATAALALPLLMANIAAPVAESKVNLFITPAKIAAPVVSENQTVIRCGI